MKNLDHPGNPRSAYWCLHGSCSQDLDEHRFGNHYSALLNGRVILATGRHVGEGFDDPRLDTLFLTLPVS